MVDKEEGMKRYETSTISTNEKVLMLEKMGTVVEITGGTARVMVMDGDIVRIIEVPTSFWVELKEVS